MREGRGGGGAGRQLSFPLLLSKEVSTEFKIKCFRNARNSISKLENLSFARHGYKAMYAKHLLAARVKLLEMIWLIL